ncbi:septum site-determining protein MinC [Noviherbaspirillum suwonense]|jgi:septum site-determining protein MinC|uniref:Probable septum site-determining protein MinC n=1 Tax=Noviherbaspirillum suwonense TaxID=1224511 RepID=A0ABY1PT72_9BURK|nr:septum site-determining protein MinC [Noviherbaspirillum suwonense]SMP46097.1 septum site-determining protein MinC [Noviherbaspirillum suwonense]
MSTTPVRKPIEIKISTVVAVAAILNDTSMPALQEAMAQLTGGAADYFDDEFAILDIGQLTQDHPPIDWPALIALFKSHRLTPVAVRNAPPALEAEIISHGLSLDVVAKPRMAARAEAQAAPAPAPAPVAAAPAAPPPVIQQPARGTMIIDTPVRAGQRVYAHGCDLIVTAAVNNGAELIADGSIHVYAPLRGRALAGASGDSDARIFAMSMEPELVSIAGYYRTFEDGLPKELAQAPGQVRLLGDRIEVIAMTSALHR